MVGLEEGGVEPITLNETLFLMRFNVTSDKLNDGGYLGKWLKRRSFLSMYDGRGDALTKSCSRLIIVSQRNFNTLEFRFYKKGFC